MRRSPALALLCVGVALASAARADVVARSFDGEASWTLQGAAAPARRNPTDDAVALRIAPARARSAGSAFAEKKQLVIGGFVAEFAIAMRSEGETKTCKTRDAGGACARGGDGMAFVIQNADARALGGGGNQLGYGGMTNCVVVEFDTHHDADARDPYNNHVAVLTRGATAPTLASHHAAIGTSVSVPDLSDGERHVVRVVYDPDFIAEDATHKSFRSGAHLLSLRNYHHGLGTMKVYVDDLAEPALTVPINLGAFLDLDAGRAWVGFTAATGERAQHHDVLSFRFRERFGGGVRPVDVTTP